MPGRAATPACWSCVTDWVDYYVAYESMEEAEHEYALLLQDPRTYIASITAVVKSTDYDPPKE